MTGVLFRHLFLVVSPSNSSAAAGKERHAVCHFASFGFSFVVGMMDDSSRMRALERIL